MTDFNVHKYVALALKTIEDIHQRGKIPVICGGTNYYIESLMFRDAVVDFGFDLKAFDSRIETLRE